MPEIDEGVTMLYFCVSLGSVILTFFAVVLLKEKGEARTRDKMMHARESEEVERMDRQARENALNAARMTRS